MQSQITKKIRRTLQKAVVEHAVAERKNWKKFGQERGNKPGPDRATTTVGENVSLKISAGNKVRQNVYLYMYIDAYIFFLNGQSSDPEPSPEDTIKASLAKAGAGKVLCRMCKGDHFTARCPYKDSLAGLESVTPAGLGT